LNPGTEEGHAHEGMLDGKVAPEDLAQTVKEVERRILAVKADVRDQGQMDDVVTRGIAEFGKIDILYFLTDVGRGRTASQGPSGCTVG
jgi:NADP-dependent 3-hydroxy acid dehydrogenase YdfG